MPQVLCAPHQKLVRVRASRLLDDCTYAVGANNSVVATGAIRLNVENEITTGTELEQKDGDGNICFTSKDDDQLKRLNLELELCTRDLDLLNILTCKNPILDGAGDTIGGIRQTGAIDCPGAVLEIWARAESSSGSCGNPAGANIYQFVHYVYPKVRFIEGGSTFEDGLNNLILTGTAEPNASALNGPFSDWTHVAGSTDAEFWEYTATAPPVGACGYGADVPADANTP